MDVRALAKTPPLHSGPLPTGETGERELRRRQAMADRAAAPAPAESPGDGDSTSTPNRVWPPPGGTGRSQRTRPPRPARSAPVLFCSVWATGMPERQMATMLASCASGPFALLSPAVAHEHVISAAAPHRHPLRRTPGAGPRRLPPSPADPSGGPVQPDITASCAPSGCFTVTGLAARPSRPAGSKPRASSQASVTPAAPHCAAYAVRRGREGRQGSETESAENSGPITKGP